MGDVRIQPTLLDAPTKMLHDCSLFSSHAVKYLQAAQDYSSRASGFVDEIGGFLSSTGYPSAWRSAPIPGNPSHVEAAPVMVPAGQEDLFRHATQHQAVADARTAMQGAVEGRLCKLLQLWLEAYDSVKGLMPKMEHLRRAMDARRARLEAARMEVAAEEAKAPLTIAPGTAGYSPEQTEEALLAAEATPAGGKHRGGWQGQGLAARVAAESPPVLTTQPQPPLQAGGLAPLPAIPQRRDMFSREGELVDATAEFEEAEKQLMSSLSWLVSTAARLKAVAAHSMMHALDAAGAREVPLDLVPLYPPHLLPPAQRPSVSQLVAQDCARLRRTVNAYRDAMGQEAYAEAMAAGAEALAAAAPALELTLQPGSGPQQAAVVSGVVPESVASSPLSDAAAAAAGAEGASPLPAPLPSAVVSTEQPPAVPAAAEAPAGSTAGVSSAAMAEGTTAKGVSVSGAKASSELPGTPGEPALPQPQPQPAAPPVPVVVMPPDETARVSLSLAAEADIAKAHAVGRREAIAKRMARDGAALGYSVHKVLVPALEQHSGAAVADRLRATHNTADARLVAVAAAEGRGGSGGGRAFDALVLAAGSAVEELMEAVQQGALPALEAAVLPDALQRLGSEYEAARAAAPSRPHAPGSGPVAAVVGLAERAVGAVGLGGTRQE